MPAVEPVADRFGHGVRLVPDDRVPQNPPVLLQGERDPPGQAEQVLGRHAGGPVRAQMMAKVGVQAGGRPPARGVRVAQVQPARDPFAEARLDPEVVGWES
jgi:hypothetical protein